MINQINNIQLNNNITFKSRLPRTTQKAIGAFTTNYLKAKDGYVSSKGSIFNGIAIAMRSLSGSSLTAWLIVEMPLMIHNDALAIITQVTTGLGSLAVAASRLENDKAATGKAKMQVLDFAKKLKAAGFSKHDELIYGIRRFMNNKGGFYTSIVPNLVSDKKAEQILNEANSKLIN